MILRFSDISTSEKTIRSHTGLSKVEFEALAEKFGYEWQAYIRCFTLEGKPRKRQSKGRKNSVLPTNEDKLLFLLYAYKLNPLQEVLATAFGLDQPQAPAAVVIHICRQPVRPLSARSQVPGRPGNQTAPEQGLNPVGA